MTTPVVITGPSLPRAVAHAMGDVAAVRSGVRASGVSDREVLEVLGSMLSLQRQAQPVRRGRVAGRGRSCGRARTCRGWA